MEAVLASIAQVHAVLKCPICNEELRRPIASIPCGHDFCEACIILSLESHGTKCPVCEQPCWRSGIVRNQMLENVVSRLQDAKKPPPPAMQTNRGRSVKLAAGSSQDPPTQTPQENRTQQKEGSATEELAAMSGSRRTDGSRGPSSKTPRSTPSIKAQKRSRSEQGQSGGKRVDKRKTGAADLKGREGEGTGPVANVEALRGRNGALEQETDQRPEVGKSEVEPAGIGPSCELPAVGDAIGGAEELGEPLSTQAESMLEAEIAAQEEELREIDAKLLAMGIDPTLRLSQLTAEQDEEPAPSTNPDPAPPASQRLDSLQPEQKSAGAVDNSSLAEERVASGGPGLAQSRMDHDAVDKSDRETSCPEAGTVLASNEGLQASEEAVAGGAEKRRTAQIFGKGIDSATKETGRGLALSGRTKRTREGLPPSSADRAGTLVSSGEKNERFRREEEEKKEAELDLGQGKEESVEKGSGEAEVGGGFTALDEAMDPFAFVPLTGGSQENGTPGKVTSGGHVVAGRSASKRGKGSEAEKELRTPKTRRKGDSDSKKVGTANRLGVTGRSKAGELALESTRLGPTGRKGGAVAAEPNFLDAPVSEPPPVAYTRRKRGAVTSPVTGKSADGGLGSGGQPSIGEKKGLREKRNGSEIETGDNSGSGRMGNEGEGSDKKRRREVVEGSEEEGEGREGVLEGSKAPNRAQNGTRGVGKGEASGAKKAKQAVRKSLGAGVAQGSAATAGRKSAAENTTPQKVGDKGRNKKGDAGLERVIAETPADGFGDWGLGLEESDLDEQGLVRGIGVMEAGTDKQVKSAGTSGPRLVAARKMPGGSEAGNDNPYDESAERLVDKRRRVGEDRTVNAEEPSEKVMVKGGVSMNNTRRIVKRKASKGGLPKRKPLRDLSQRPRGSPQGGDYDQDLREALARSLADV